MKRDMMRLEAARFMKRNARGITPQNSARGYLQDSLKFVFYCILLALPLYAITVSVVKHDWIMVIIDALIVPVGFVHGLLLLFGYVS